MEKTIDEIKNRINRLARKECYLESAIELVGSMTAKHCRAMNELKSGGYELTRSYDLLPDIEEIQRGKERLNNELNLVKEWKRDAVKELTELESE